MKKAYYFGVDVGGTFTKAALVDAAGKILSRIQVSSAGFNNKAYFAETLYRAVLRLALEARIPLRSVRGMGIGLPGPVDAQRGIILSLTNIRGWSHFSLVRFLKGRVPFPVFIENDANCMALAESRIGAAKGASFALCLTLGTGVGGGLILDREIYRGPFFLGGEVGHMPLDAHGPVCECGGTGCLERYVGNQAIAARARKVFGRDVRLEDMSRMARSGDRRAGKVWKDVALHLALAIGGLMNVLGPEVVVIGGGVAQAGPALLTPLRAYVKKYAMRHLKAKVKITAAALGNDAGLLGAALLAKEKLGQK
ncbi:MAG: ROK family protein [Candidatus Omnitrophica bacterium]|nr:ROK family protein [Candidatus Omnitrophota bacterium]MDD5573986.1 ROK family protein [Candidatus Omnitrophota bacterium]